MTSSSSTLPGLGDQSVLSYRVQVLPQSRTRDRCALGVPLVWLCDLCLRTRKVLRVWPESVPGSVIFFLGCFPTLRTVTGNLDCVWSILWLQSISTFLVCKMGWWWWWWLFGESEWEDIFVTWLRRWNPVLPLTRVEVVPGIGDSYYLLLPHWKLNQIRGRGAFQGLQQREKIGKISCPLSSYFQVDGDKPQMSKINSKSNGEKGYGEI